MKQNYIYLIILLTISHTAFSMEEDLEKWFQETEAKAKSYSRGSPFALFYYGQLVDKSIPPYSTSPDPYEETRRIQDEAYDEISDKADELKKEKKFEDALKVYKYAPLAFAQQIKTLEERLAVEKLRQESTAELEKSRKAEQERKKIELEQLKQEKERLEIERHELEKQLATAEAERKRQEQQLAEAERQKTKKLEQELKNTLILLINKLKSLANHLLTF